MPRIGEVLTLPNGEELTFVSIDQRGLLYRISDGRIVPKSDLEGEPQPTERIRPAGNLAELDASEPIREPEALDKAEPIRMSVDLPEPDFSDALEEE